MMLAVLAQLEVHTNNPLPIDVYSLLLTDDVIEHIVCETNRYAEQEIEKRVLTRRSRMKG